MVRFFPIVDSDKSRKTTVTVLAFAWFLGLVLGLFTALSAKCSYLLLLQSVPYGQRTLVGLATSVLLPLILTISAACCFRFWALILVAFLEAFLLLFTATGIVLIYGYAGWLMIVLVLFSKILFLPVFLFLLFHACGDRNLFFRNCCFAAFISLWVCYFDYQFVSPFLERLLTL